MEGTMLCNHEVCDFHDGETGPFILTNGNKSHYVASDLLENMVV